MSKQPTTLVIPTAQHTSIDRAFTGFYKHRNTPPMNISFYWNGDLKTARDRFKQHCNVMGYIYLQVVPMIVDLDHREKLRNDNGNDFNIDS